MCGNYDGNIVGEMIMENHGIASSVREFGSSWIIPNNFGCGPMTEPGEVVDACEINAQVK